MTRDEEVNELARNAIALWAAVPADQRRPQDLDRYVQLAVRFRQEATKVVAGEGKAKVKGKSAFGG